MGRIIIRATEVDEDIVIHIIDDGVGMDVKERCPLTLPSPNVLAYLMSMNACKANMVQGMVYPFVVY